MTDCRLTYEEYLERKKELKEAVLKQIGEKDQAYIESIEPLTEEEWTEIQRIVYGRVSKKN